MASTDPKTENIDPGTDPALREALQRAFGGLVADLGSHDSNRDPDADADAAQRSE